MSESISAEFRESCLFIKLDHQEHANSFGINEANQLSKVIKEFSSNENLKSLVFQSSGSRFFCTGGNLKFYANQKTKEEGIESNLFIRNTLDQLSQLPVPSLCIIDGDCLGGGMELISCFDFLVSTPHSFFGFWQRRIALSFGWGGGERWQKRIPPQTLKTLALETCSLSSYEAAELGLIDRVCSSNGIDQVISTWISRMSGLPQAPVAGIKTFSSVNEASLFESLWHNPEHINVLNKYKK